MDIATQCRDCAFAVYDGNAQVGCRLGRLDKFREQGTPVVEDYDVDPSYDVEAACIKAQLDGTDPPVPPADPNGRRYYNVGNRICTALRRTDSEWVRATPPDRWADKVREECRLRLHVIVLADDSTYGLDAVMKTARSLESQDMPARAVTFVLNSDHLRPSALVARLRNIGPALAWNVRDITERKDDGSRVDSGRCVDLVVDTLDHKQSQFYCVFHAGFVVPPAFVSELDEALNGQLERFLMLTPVSLLAAEVGWGTGYFEGLVVQTRLHQMVGGHREAEVDGPDGPIRVDSVQAKIAQMAKDDGSDFLVKNVVDVCPSLR